MKTSKIDCFRAPTLATALLVLFQPCLLATEAGRTSEAVTATRYDVFQEMSPSNVVPGGWLREFLERQRSGLTGHREILSYPFDTCLWAGLIPRKGDSNGKDWWRYEQTAYLTDGILRLGYVLGDDALIKTGSEGVKYILAHPMASNRLGHPFFESQWPMAVFFRVMEAEYLATRNPDLLEAMRKHYLSYSVGELTTGHRHIVNLEGMLWTYGQTGDRRLLDLAERAYRVGGDEMPLERCETPDEISIHGVTYMEEAKLPAILYIYTGNPEYLKAAVNAFQNLDRDHMLADGVPSSNEFLVSKNPINSHETCDISDYTWSLGYLLMATGDATWADHIEKAVFNAGPGAVSKDFRNLQYFSSVNQFIATGTSNSNMGSAKLFYGSTWMAYWPCHETECCAGNVHRFMPNFAARMWMRDQHGGLVAALYGPSATSVAVDHGKSKVTVVEATDYPFADGITFRFSTPAPVPMRFSFRIPGWCDSPVAAINGRPYAGELPSGKFVTIDRIVRDGDVVSLRFPMKATIVACDKWGSAVEYGPLLFAYAVPESVSVDSKVYPNLRGKKSADPVNYPALDIRPAGPWNFALAARGPQDLVVSETGSKGYPFDPGRSPLVIKVPVMRVKDWVLRENRFTPPLPEAGKFECEPTVESITLVPYGSTRLRMGVFPVAPQS